MYHSWLPLYKTKDRFGSSYDWNGNITEVLNQSTLLFIIYPCLYRFKFNGYYVPVLNGMKIILHASPLDHKIVQNYYFYITR
jgi:hypothetical protein